MSGQTGGVRPFDELTEIGRLRRRNAPELAPYFQDGYRSVRALPELSPHSSQPS